MEDRDPLVVDLLERLSLSASEDQITYVNTLLTTKSTVV